MGLLNAAVPKRRAELFRTVAVQLFNGNVEEAFGQLVSAISGVRLAGCLVGAKTYPRLQLNSAWCL